MSFIAGWAFGPPNVAEDRKAKDLKPEEAKSDADCQGNRPQVPDLFKRLSLQPRLSERLSSVIEMGRTVETPIKLGLAWIE